MFLPALPLTLPYTIWRLRTFMIGWNVSSDARASTAGSGCRVHRHFRHDCGDGVGAGPRRCGVLRCATAVGRGHLHGRAWPGSPCLCHSCPPVRRPYRRPLPRPRVTTAVPFVAATGPNSLSRRSTLMSPTMGSRRCGKSCTKSRRPRSWPRRRSQPSSSR